MSKSSRPLWFNPKLNHFQVHSCRISFQIHRHLHPHTLLGPVSRQIDTHLRIGQRATTANPSQTSKVTALRGVRLTLLETNEEWAAGLYWTGGFVSHARKASSKVSGPVRATNKSINMSRSCTDKPNEKTHLTRLVPYFKAVHLGPSRYTTSRSSDATLRPIDPLGVHEDDDVVGPYIEAWASRDVTVMEPREMRGILILRRVRGTRDFWGSDLDVSVSGNRQVTAIVVGVVKESPKYKRSTTTGEGRF